MSATYKLSYFNLRGLAENSRVLFAAAGVPYEDFRFPFVKNEDGTFDRKEWEQAKPNFLWEKVPTLEVNGHVIAQSKSIERFLARRFGFAGTTDLETADIDNICEQVLDARNGYYNANGKDDAIKAAGVTVEDSKKNVTKFMTDDFPNFMRLFERYLNRHNHDWFVGNKISLADIAFFTFVTNPNIPKDVLAKYPKCAALAKRVGDVPSIASWIAKRPQTQF